MIILSVRIFVKFCVFLNYQRPYTTNLRLKINNNNEIELIGGEDLIMASENYNGWYVVDSYYKFLGVDVQGRVRCYANPCQYKQFGSVGGGTDNHKCYQMVRTTHSDPLVT